MRPPGGSLLLVLSCLLILTIEASAQAPAGGVAAQVLTSPYHIVAVPVRMGTVRFEPVEQERPARSCAAGLGRHST